MEGTANIDEVIIGAHTKDYNITGIKLTPQSFIVEVQVADTGDGLAGETLYVDMTDEWALLSQTKKDDFNGLLKKAAAKGMNITPAEITGNLWD